MKNDKRMKEFLVWAVRAIAAGVELRLKDWERFSPEEQDWWLAARRFVAAPPERAPEPDPHDFGVPYDPELRQVLEAGAGA